MGAKVEIICKGVRTTATETLPGVHRCDGCGERVRVLPGFAQFLSIAKERAAQPVRRAA